MGAVCSSNKAGAEPAATKVVEDAEEVVDIPDNAETNKAATKMQAIQRGKKARKEVEAKKEKKGAKGGKKEKTEEIDIPDNEETNAVATKMQAIQRGKLARKEVEAKKAAKAESGSQEGAGGAGDAAAPAEEEIDIPDNEETNAVATKMQAIQRGKMARKEVVAKKEAKVATS